MTDTAIAELVPGVGVRDACQLFGQVDSRHHRRARDECLVREGFVGPLVCPDPTVRRTNPFPVAIPVDQLVIVQHDVNVWEDPFHELPGDVAGRFDRRVDAALMRPGEHRRTEIGLQQDSPPLNVTPPPDWS